VISVASLVVAATSAPPHILFIVSDDLGWDDLGFRSHQIRTPTLDKLASEGRVLNHYYVQDVCSPSRATFQTGRYPLHTTVNDWLRGTGVLPLNETITPQKLKPAGYVGHAVGKWHLGYAAWQYTPTFRGFESFYGFYTGGQDYFTHGGTTALDFHLEIGERCGLNCSEPQFDAVGVYSTHLFSARAEAIIAAHDPSAPLYLYLAYQAVHAPREVPASYADAYNATIDDTDRRVFAGMLSCMDEGIGNVTAALTKKGLLDNTFIVFTTDNGGPVPDTPGGDYVGSRNFPLRGGKHSIWEGGTRGTAFIWSGANTGLIQPALVGQPVEALMHAADWLPTLCSVAGVKGCGDTGLPLDGIDVSGPLFTNTTGGHQYILYGQHDDAPNAFTPYDDAVRDASGWKLIQGWGGKPADWSSSPPNLSAVDESAHCSTSNCAVDPLLNPYGLPPARMHLPRDLNCSATQPCCYIDFDMAPHHVADAADCCAVCQGMVGCVGWVFNANFNAPHPNCFPKSQMVPNKQQCRAGCTSGGHLSPPAPPSPAPPTPQKNGTMLFNVVDDPTEHDEVSAANPDIVARLSGVLNAFRATANTAVDPLNCSSPSGHVAPQGKYVVPWCTVKST